MALLVSNKSRKLILETFENMAYGPASEADNVAQAWLDKHERSFSLFIGNAWEKLDGRKTYISKNPSNGETLANTIQAENVDVDHAVRTAKEAQVKWGNLSGHVRARHMYSIARHLQKHSRLLAVIESMDNGKSVRESRDLDVPTMIRHFMYYAGWAQLMETELPNWKPLGVVAAIVPWNFPLMLLTWKLAPAIAAGNTVVLKPATYTRLSALLLAEICAEAGLPSGVFNVVTGPGSIGSYLASHADVSKVAFTGSTGVGKVLRRLTAGTGKKLSLELGGKSPVVVFENADLDSTVEGVVDAIWFNQGQVCSAGSRLLVQESIFDKFNEKLKARLRTFRMGSSLEKTIDMGPLVDQSQWDTVNEYVEEARRQGAEIFQAVPPPARGFNLFYPPTLITGVNTSSRVVHEEIFGPVLCSMPFRTAKEAVALSNNSCYGLAASVWTENLPTALEVAFSIKAGTIWINSHNLFDAAAGFGGYRQSGFGRDGGKEGFYEYLKPSWQQFVRPTLDKDFDISKFGVVVPVTPGGLSATTTKKQTTSDNQVPRIDRTYKMYMGGKQTRPDGMYSRLVVSMDGISLGNVGDGNRKDIRNAVAAAHSAAPGWGKRAAFNRAQIMYYLAENLDVRKEEFVRRLVEMGFHSEAEANVEVELSIARLYHWAAFADKFGGDVQETTLYGATVKVHEPVGVLAIVCPSDGKHPLLSFVSLLAPAVVRANSVVIIPDERNPLPALDLYQVFDTSDIPGGVINIVTGSSDHLTKHLSDHQDVQGMWYFGSAEGSKYVEDASASNVKRTWVNYGETRDWTKEEQATGMEFLHHSVQCKNIWMPAGVTFAN